MATVNISIEKAPRALLTSIDRGPVSRVTVDSALEVGGREYRFFLGANGLVYIRQVGSEKKPIRLGPEGGKVDLDNWVRIRGVRG